MILWGIGTLLCATLICITGIKPFIRWGWRFCLKWIVGLALLYLVNRYGHGFGWYVPMNALTTSVAGLLGIPGTAALVYVYGRARGKKEVL